MQDSQNSTLAVELTEVAFRWPGSTAFRLSVPSFTLERGSRLLLLGESGSGKSTLLSLICGIVAVQEGRITVDGQDLQGLSSGARDRFRAEHIGVIFQQFNLLPYATALDNILLPLHFAPARRRRAGNTQEEALRLAEAMGLPRALMTAGTAGALSVGQQQRVAVARALIGQPSLIVADEPTSALDAATQTSFLDLLFARCAEAGSSLLMVSHDERLAGRFDQTIKLEDIAVVDRGDAGQGAAA